MTALSITDLKRFWGNVRKTKTCWFWKASTAAGYGQIYFHGHRLKAHRVSYELARGKITDGVFLCHRCDVRHCVNPDHLFMGTQKDNIADAMAKGRMKLPRLRGSKNPLSKLTSHQVLSIRKIAKSGKVSQRAMAKEFGICQQTVCDIVNRRRWKWL